MVTEFAEAIAEWKDFYTLAGSAAFTLLGLLFVAVSINIDVIARLDDKGDIRSLAYLVFRNFLEIMIIGLMFVIPNPKQFWFAIPFLFIGFLNLAKTTRTSLQLRHSHRLLNLSDLLGNFLIPNIICY